MKKVLITFLLCILYNVHAEAQSCGNCKARPKLALYDLDVQVPQPALEGDKTIGWLQWLRLFEIAGKIKFSIFNSSGNCIMIIQPNDSRLSSESFTTKDGIEVPPLVEESDQLKVGPTYTNLAPSGDLSRFGDYITTGYIKPQGNGFVLAMEIQAACSRTVIAQASVAFDSLQNSSMTESVAYQAASQLSPLIDKINQFELDERQKNKHLSLFQIEGEPMKLTLAKNTLKAGESTNLTIELKDCDNIPLQGREIFFTETVFEGLKVFGTVGGIVTPAKLITDANGKATARFTLKPGAKEAIINAHSPGNNVKGCSSMFVGDAAVNIRSVYSGHITFTHSSSSVCNDNSADNCSLYTMMSNSRENIVYTAAFYDDQSGDNGIELSSETDQSLVPRIMETGSYEKASFNLGQSEITCGGENLVTTQKTQSRSAGDLKSGSFRYWFGDQSNGTLSIDLVYRNETEGSFQQTHLPSAKQTFNEETGWSFHVTEGVDKDFVFTKEKTAGKMKYTVSGTRTTPTKSKCGHLVTIETIKMVVNQE